MDVLPDIYICPLRKKSAPRLILKNKTTESYKFSLNLLKIFFLLFFHFPDLRNLVKWMDSKFPCYSLLNMKVFEYIISC